MASRSPLLSRRYTIVRTAIRLAFLMILVGLPIRYTLDSPLILPITLPPNLGKDVAVPAVDLAVSTLVAPALPVVPFAIMILLPLIFGRGLCGWICPIGLLHEVASLRRKEGKITIYRKAKYLFLAGALLTGLSDSDSKGLVGHFRARGRVGSLLLVANDAIRSLIAHLRFPPTADQEWLGDTYRSTLPRDPVGHPADADNSVDEDHDHRVHRHWCKYDSVVLVQVRVPLGGSPGPGIEVQLRPPQEGAA